MENRVAYKKKCPVVSDRVCMCKQHVCSGKPGIWDKDFQILNGGRDFKVIELKKITRT